MSEDKDLQAKIAALSGRINRHKQQAEGEQVSSFSIQGGRYDGSWRAPRARPYNYSRGGISRAPVQIHRNKTLLMKNGIKSPGVAATFDDVLGSNDTVAAADSDSTKSPPSWVLKKSRHMQLINSTVYDELNQERTRSIKASLEQRQKKHSLQERARVQQHFQQMSTRRHHDVVVGTREGVQPQEIEIEHLRFRVTDGGSKLIRVSTDPNTARATPKRTKVAGVTFVRSKNGNLYRSGLVKSKRENSVKKLSQLCPKFTSTGACTLGPACRYTHDLNRLAICKDFLQKGSCTAADACDLSHEPTPHRVPACLHFLRGNCTNDSCRYAHVHVNPSAPVCRDFAKLGYCEKGPECVQRHVYDCPDYANNGVCRNKNCRLPHVDRAGQIRKAVVSENEASREGDDSADFSSDEDYHEINSDDVNSDGLEEADDYNMSEQHDFIHL